MVVIDGIEFLRTSEVCQRLAPDVGPETLRNWYAPRGRAQQRLKPVCDPDGRPVRLDGEYLFAWPEVVEAEHAARTARTGRRRGGHAGL